MKYTRAISHFWIWFQRHSSKYRHLTCARSNKEFLFWYDELQMHARAFCKLLSVDLYIPPNGKAQLIITANGRKLGFRRAEQLANRAPEIENWTVIALRQPKPPDQIMQWVGSKVDIDISKIWFQAATPQFPDVYPIKIFVEYILPDKEWEVHEYAMQIIEHLVGEKVAVMNIEVVEVDSRCNASKRQRLRPLAELPEFMADKTGILKIGADGRLKHIINEP
jgi:hypothetical protein